MRAGKSPAVSLEELGQLFMKTLGGLQVNEVPDILENLDPSILHSWRKFLGTVGDVAHPVPVGGLGKRLPGAVRSRVPTRNRTGFSISGSSCTTGWPHIA